MSDENDCLTIQLSLFEFVHDVGNRTDNIVKAIDQCAVHLNASNCLDASTEVYLNIAKVECVEISLLKDNLLAFAKVATSKTKSSPRFVLTEVRAYFNRIIDSYAVLSVLQGRQIKLMVNGDVPVKIFASTAELDLIVGNILSNALKYGDDDTPVNVEVASDRSSWQICISNVGKAISAQELNHIFEAFYRGRNEANGNGLGLYIAKKNVELLNGRISVESWENGLTKFTISLPLHKQQFLASVPKDETGRCLTPHVPIRI